ncbi:unnamed protein product, partial [marine sediment metagenome]
GIYKIFDRFKFDFILMDNIIYRLRALLGLILLTHYTIILPF